MIKSIDNQELQTGMIVAESYYNGYWFGIVEKPSYFADSVIACRVLGGDYSFFDIHLTEGTYKYLSSRLDHKLAIIENLNTNPSALHPKYIELYHMKIKDSHPHADRLQYNRLRVTKHE